MALAIVPATIKSSPTFAALGTVGLTKRQSQLYGLDAKQVLRLVAFDPRSGRVLHAPVAGPHDPALGPTKKFMPPDPPKAPSGAILPTTFGFNFNLDAVAKLNLPGDAASYTIVAWIEDLVSESAVIELPEDKARFPATPFYAPPTVTSPINVRTLPETPPRKKQEIRSVVLPPEAGAEGKIGRVLISIGPGVLPAVAPGVEGAPKHLAVIAQTALDRRMSVHSVRLPAAVFDATGAGDVDFEVADLLPPETKTQPVFLIVLAGAKVSGAITVVPPGFKD